MDHPLVSIGIPTYNRADGYLRDAIESAIRQTYPNIELIVSDNCSSDDTETVVRLFDDKRIKYFRHSVNIGPNNNFNFCVEKAKGKYFLLLHDDDLIDRDFIEACVKEASSSPDVGIIRTGTRIINSEGNVINNYPNGAKGLSVEEFFRCWFACKTSFYLCSTLFNTRRLKEIGGFDSKNNLFQDVFAEVELAAKHGRVDIEEVMASFRKHPEEITFSAKVKSWCEDSLLLLDLMCDLVPQKKEIIRREGMQFLSGLNYQTANEVKSSLKRFIAYMVVFKSYNYGYLPPPVISYMRFLKAKSKNIFCSLLP